KKKERKSEDSGYVPVFSILSNGPLLETNIDSSRLIYDRNIINAFLDIISICKKDNIELVFTGSPIFLKNPKGVAEIKNLCRKNHILFLDYFNQEPYMTHPEYFSSLDHLNDNGAKIYSASIAAEINKLINLRSN
ncbi:MAG: hypothetical protein WCL00_08345, partial [Bacteroidota bacterium]